MSGSTSCLLFRVLKTLLLLFVCANIFIEKYLFPIFFFTADKRELWKKYYTVTANGAWRYVGIAVQTLFLLCLVCLSVQFNQPQNILAKEQQRQS